MKARLQFSSLVFILSFLNFNADAQNISENLNVSGFLESYYSYDFGKPASGNRPGFLYNFTRHNEITTNLAMIQLDFDEHRTRGRVSLMAGTYANANLAAEQGVMRNIFEAFVGYKLSDSKKLWLDVGVFESHLGFESAVGSRNQTLSRSLAAEGSPYFLSGAKVTFVNKDETLTLLGVVTNGWQRMQRQEGNNLISVGHQILWKPIENLTLNSSSFIGGDSGYPTTQNYVMRYFHNFFTQYELNNGGLVTLGWDIGMQERERKSSEDFLRWNVFSAIVQLPITEKLWTTVRWEHFNDSNTIIVREVEGLVHDIGGYSANIDYRATERMMFRLEARYFDASNEIFLNEGTPSSSNFGITTSVNLNF